MNQQAESYRRMLFRLVRFGGMAVVAVLVLTACYTDVVVQPSPTAGSLSAVTNVPTQSNAQPTQGNQVKPPPTQGGGGGGQQNQDGGGGGGSPEAVSATATRTPLSLLGSPVATSARTVVVPPGSTTTPTTRPGTTPVRPVGTAVPTRSAQGVGTRPAGVTQPAGTMTTGVTPPRTGTTPAGVTPPAGVTVTTTSETSGSPSPSAMLVITKHENFANEIIAGACFAILSGETTVATACDQREGDRDDRPGVIAIEAPPGVYMLRETSPPPGYTSAEDRQIELVAQTPLEIDVIDHLMATAEGSPSSTTSNGYVIATLVGPDGQPPTGKVCLSLTGDQGTYQACDNDLPGDVDPTPGIIEIDNVVPGEYALTITPPVGYEAVDPQPSVPVPASGAATFTVTFRAVTTTSATETPTEEPTTDTSQPTEEPTLEASPPTEEPTTETATETATTEATPLPAGNLLVSVYDASGAQLGGACVTLTGPGPRQICDDGEGDADPTTAGLIDIVDVVPGDYTVTAQAPENYEPVGPVETNVTVPSGEIAQATFTFQSTVTTGWVQINKVDATDGVTPLGGACFEVSGDNGTYAACDDQAEDKDELAGADGVPGVIVIENVVAGDYTLRETQAPPDRVAGPDQQIHVDAGQTAMYTVMNGTPTPPEPGSLNLRALDPDGNSVAGACFTVAPVGGESTEGCDDGDSVVTFEGLAAGDYTVTLSKIPDGYEAADVTEQTVTVVAGQPSDMAFQVRLAQPTTGTIVITKIDQATGTALGQACFTATTAGTEPIVLCDDDDGLLRFENLAPGEYTVTESTVPNGYLGATEQTVTVTAGVESPLTFENQPAPTTGTLTVYAANPEGAPITGACYTATGPNEATAQGCDDDNNGDVPLGDVVAGDWKVTEVSPPAGYAVADPVEQSVTVTAGQPAEVRFVNQPNAPQTGSILITVQDDQGQALSGACFDLVIAEQPTHACDDTENDADPNPGTILVQNLAPGDYMVTESKVPDGYRGADPQPTTVVPGTEPARLAFTNIKEPEGVPVPSPVVYEDEIGRLWLLRPGDTAPIRLDADDRPFDRTFAPVFSFDRTWVAFLVVDSAKPAANMVWVKIDDLTYGGVDFTGVGTPRQIAWLPGSTDTLMVATELPTGGFNVYYYRTTTSELPVTLFPPDQPPASIQAITPAPNNSQLVAIQATDANGDPDVYIVNTADPAPVPLNVGPNTDAGADQFIAWSPVGDRLLLQTGDGLVYVVDGAGNAIPLGTTPVFPGDASFGTAPQWSADGSWISVFEGDPAAGGQMRFYDGNGNTPCEPIPNVVATDWSPSDGRLWALVAPPNEQMRLVAIGLDCAVQDATLLDGSPDKLLWAPNGGALAIVDKGDVTTVQFWAGDQLLPIIDAAAAGVGITDVLAWSPGGEMLALLAGGPSPSIWVVTPGSAVPVAVSGSAVLEGATYVNQVWWG